MSNIACIAQRVASERAVEKHFGRCINRNRYLKHKYSG